MGDVDLSADIIFALKASSYQEVMKRLDAILGLSGVATDVANDEATVQRRELFQADVSSLRQRMRNSRKGFLNPRSPRVQYWDMTTGIAVLYTCFVTPFEVAIITESSGIDALFVTNQVINLIFFIDMFVQFVMPVADPVTGELIRNHKRLAKLYLRSWFPIDFISVLPIDVVVAAAPGIVPVENTSLVRIFKLLRVLRLAKLARVLRASRIIQRWENAIAISSSMRSIITAWFGFIIVLHWFACTWAMLPQFISTWREIGATFDPPFLEHMALVVEEDSTGECTACNVAGAVLPEGSAGVWQCGTQCLTPCEQEEIARLYNVPVSYVYNQESWMCRAAVDGLLAPDFAKDYFRVWMTSMLIAFFQLVGGLGQITPNNLPETTAYLVAIFVGTIIFAMLQGIIVQVLTTGDPDETDFKQKLDALNFMMRDNHIEKETRTRVRHFFRMSKTMLKRRSYVTLIDDALSDELRGDVRYLVSQALFDGVWYLANCEQSFLEDLSLFVTREGYAAGERIETGDYLNVLVQGVCSRGGSIMLEGAFWGDAIITAPALRDTRDAKAVAYCEVARVNRDAIAEVAKNYPKSAEVLRTAGLKLATKRAFVLCSMVARIVSHKQGSGTTSKPGGAGGGVGGGAGGAGLKRSATAWSLLKSHVGKTYNPILRALRSNLLTQNKQLAFQADVPPLDARFTATSVLQAMHHHNALRLPNDGPNGTSSAGTQGGWRELDELNEPGTTTADAAEADSATEGKKRARPPVDQTTATMMGAMAELGKRVDSLAGLMQTMEENRRSDSRETLDRLARLEAARSSIVSGASYAANGHDADFREEALGSRGCSVDAPQSVMRKSTRARGRMMRQRVAPPSGAPAAAPNVESTPGPPHAGAGATVDGDHRCEA